MERFWELCCLIWSHPSTDAAGDPGLLLSHQLQSGNITTFALKVNLQLLTLVRSDVYGVLPHGCRQYVQQYFTCSECSQHFEAMAAEEAAALVTSRRDAVLWSWRAHNIVRTY